MQVWHIWLISGIALFIAEILIPGFLVACFGVGCLASALVARLGGCLEWQIVAFIVGTLVVYFTIRPMFIKYFYNRMGSVRTNVDALVGCVGVVTETIDPDTRRGRVKVRGEDWRGVALDEVVIEPGQKVEVVRVDGTKLLVKPIAKPQEG